MKILAIRGENIASLCAPFDVDLSHGPLGDAGLFAIAGPTGSGKTTLLDTICLALFDTTPRLSERGGAWVGRADADPKLRLKANDVRGLLSRGTASGFAEVEFLGTDNRRYRARWSVRRSRNKPSGPLQKQSMSLCDVETDRKFGDKKTEVLAAIEARLGLTFEQFKRSAMLAQGDFAAFLHADDRNRADLLERVTGTEVYSRISKASYDRTTSERRAYDALVTQAERLGRLTPDKRAELLSVLDLTQVSLASAENAHTQATKTLTWFEELTTLEKRVGEAVLAVDAAREVVTSAHPRRQHLKRVIAMAPLRLPLSRRDDAARQHADIVTAEITAVAAHRLAGQAKEQARKTADDASEMLRTVRATQAEQEPAVAQARSLDAKIEEVVSAEAKSKALLSTATQRTATTAAQVTSLTQEIAATQERAASAQAWTTAHPHAARLAGVIEPLERALTTLATATSRESELVATHPALLETDSAARETLANARAAELTHAAQMRRCDTALHLAKTAITDDARPALDARQQHLDQQRERLTQLDEAHRAAKAAEIDRARVAQEQTDLQAATAVDTEALEQSTALHVATTARLTEAEHSLDALRAALSATELRTNLTPGEPCSVCGSEDHPWATEDIVGGLYKTATGRVATLKSELAAHTQTLAVVRARLTAAETTQSQLTQRLATAGAAFTRALQTWTQSIAGTSMPVDPLQGDDALQVERSQLTTAMDALRAEAKQLLALETALRDAQRAYYDASAKQQSATGRLALAEGEAHKAAQAVADSIAKQSEAKQTAQTALDTVADALGDRDGWQAQATADAAGLRTDLSAEAAMYTAHNTTLQEADATLAKLRPKLAESTALATAAQADLAEKKSQHSAHAKHLSELRAARMDCLQGESVTAVVERNKQALLTAEQAHTAAVDKHQATVATLSSADGALASVRKQLQATQSAATLAQKVLNTSLDTAQVDEPTAISLLDHSEAWVQAETHDLRAIDRAVQTAETVLAERKASVQEHSESAPQGSQDEAVTAVASTKATLDSAREAHGDNAAALRRDNEARQQGQELDDLLSAQHAVVDQWAAISDVIGSADGKVFRTFAQGLTLDALLVYANHHLEDLAPRYRLQRVPREDLALQVIDQDMGDEVRAIPSLSGGETFLTSLALALGLSSLAASETPVESLFIDEGFGTLDRDTLEVALAALDALQASGRQVGLISHVDGLSEHIGVAIHIQKLGAGKSRVVLPSSDATP